MCILALILLNVSNRYTFVFFSIFTTIYTQVFMHE